MLNVVIRLYLFQYQSYSVIHMIALFSAED